MFVVPCQWAQSANIENNRLSSSSIWLNIKKKRLALVDNVVEEEVDREKSTLKWIDFLFARLHFASCLLSEVVVVPPSLAFPFTPHPTLPTTLHVLLLLLLFCAALVSNRLMMMNKPLLSCEHVAEEGLFLNSVPRVLLFLAAEVCASAHPLVIS